MEKTETTNKHESARIFFDFSTVFSCANLWLQSLAIQFHHERF